MIGAGSPLVYIRISEDPPQSSDEFPAQGMLQSLSGEGAPGIWIVESQSTEAKVLSDKDLYGSVQVLD